MKKTSLLFILGLTFFGFACDSSETTNEVSVNTINTTTNNTTEDSDSSESESKEEKLAKLALSTTTNAIDAWQKKDSIRDSKEPHIWVYQIGDSYDDDDLAAKAFDKLKEAEVDVYVFRRKRKEYYLIKGIGETERKILDDSLSNVQKRVHARIQIIDLSKECRKLPTNTDAIKYKIDGEKKYADCKKCE
ncbi:MAG: hypothetical protein J0L69_05215 [Bacteroidetes bacterium]|nr:hypothetical protein [Bacteroidota bacterium]